MRVIPASELIINADGSVFHLHLKPEQLADRVVLVGDPDRVSAVADYFDSKECEVQNREFHSITGTYQGKRITVVSHGIGPDNIEIVLNELDALANIDFATRTVKPEFRSLTMVRIGTSGGLQPNTPVGTFVASEKSIGFNAMIYFYANSRQIRDLDLEEALLAQLDWQIEGLRPYVVSSDPSLYQQIAGNDMVRGLTIAAEGFYAPQGRVLRLPLADPELNHKIEAFAYRDYKITNFEMESSAVAALAALMGHRSLTVCCIIADRLNRQMNTGYRSTLPDLIERVLDRI
ncbi:MAG: nucleoside phosphorylase [Parabacteroides sp.]